MVANRWVKVDATIVECFRAWEEPLRSAHPRFEIVADIKNEAGEVERVSSQQTLNARTHHWRQPILVESCPRDGIPSIGPSAWSWGVILGTTRG